MRNPENLDMKVERSRRKVVKIGALLTSAIVAALATTKDVAHNKTKAEMGAGITKAAVIAF
jgi:hypothetical protein